MPVTGSDQLVHLTTRIETSGPSGIGSGTGFFIALKIHEKQIPLLVTNKHVVEGATTGWINFNLKGPDGDPLPGQSMRIEMTDFDKAWIHHPDPEVDLVAHPFAPIVNQMEALGKPAFYRTISTEMIAKQSDLEKLTAMENIVMVGYPNGIWDSKNNRPIIRRGITATPAYDLFEGTPRFVIDCACFPGSSGSPVLVYDHMHVDKQGNTNLTNRILLVGVLYAGPQWTAEGEIITITIPTSKQKQIAQIPVMINLGYCVRADQLLWFEEYLKLHVQA